MILRSWWATKTELHDKKVDLQTAELELLKVIKRAHIEREAHAAGTNQGTIGCYRRDIRGPDQEHGSRARWEGGRLSSDY